MKPFNLKSLFECYDIFTALNLPSKIGADLRSYTYGAWAGFVYGDTLDQGQENYRIVREAIPKKVPVILKRGCTEMEKLLDSDKWDEVSDRDMYFERKLNKLFAFSEEMYYQAKWLKQEIKENWILRAIEIGDPTAREMAEAHSDNPDIWKKLVVHSVTYHEEK